MDNLHIRTAPAFRKRNAALVFKERESVPLTDEMRRSYWQDFQYEFPDAIRTVAFGRSYNYLSDEELMGLLFDGAVHQGFPLKDLALEVFADLSLYRETEFCWGFCSQAEKEYAAVIRIGEILRIDFDEKFRSVEHVLSDNPLYVHQHEDRGDNCRVEVTNVSTTGFDVISSHPPSETGVSSRRAALRGFKVFGTLESDPILEVWRDYLGRSVREALLGKWDQSLLYCAFALESFIDVQLKKLFHRANFSHAYVEHVLAVAQKPQELLAINDLAPHPRTEKEVRELSHKLRQSVFEPRNNLAHGASGAASVTPKVAATAIRVTTTFIWEHSQEARASLFCRYRGDGANNLVDEKLRNAVIAAGYDERK